MSVKYSLDHSLSKAKSFAKKGNIEEAVKLYQAILSDFPKNVRAQKELETLQTYSGKGPPQEEIKKLVNLYNKRQFSASIQLAQLIIREYPRAIIVWNILGGSYEGLGQFKKSFMETISNKIVNSIRGINRVVYDITSKPPSTIELE